MANAIKYTLRPHLEVHSIDDTDYLKQLFTEYGPVFNQKHITKGLTPRPMEEKIDYILKNLLTVIIEDQYILIVDRIESWFATEKVLQEELLIRYAKGSATLHDVMQVLEDLKVKLNCDAIQVGTLACQTDKEHFALMKKYQSVGFKLQQLSLWR